MDPSEYIAFKSPQVQSQLISKQGIIKIFHNDNQSHLETGVPPALKMFQIYLKQWTVSNRIFV